MTKQLCDTLNLPHLEDVLKDAASETPPTEPDVDEPSIDDDTLAHMQQALAQVRKLSPDMMDNRDHADSLEDLYKETLKHAQDLMDLGFNVDVRSARGIFEVATSMFTNAINAKNAKRDAQLKTAKLMLDERKLRLAERQFEANEGVNIVESAQVITIDRNDLIRQAQERIKKTKPEN